MSYTEINWPLNPNIGDKLQAVRGGSWIWDGCAWTHTCCYVSSCDIRVDGLSVGVSFLGTEVEFYYLQLPATQVYCLNYQGGDVWKSVPVGEGGDQLVLFVRFEYGQWVFGFETYSSESLILATLAGSEPVGTWELLEDIFDGPAEITSQCGCFPSVCLRAKKNSYESEWEFQTTMYPILEYVPGSLSGNVLAYSTAFDSDLAITAFNGEWYLISKDTDLLAVLPGVYPDLPVGTEWEPISISGEYFIETLEGTCPCDPSFDGLTLVMELKGDVDFTYYSSFTKVSETLYESPDPGIYISYSGGSWGVYGGPGPTLIGTLSVMPGVSPVGDYIIENQPEDFPEIASISMICGTNPINTGCMVILRDSSPNAIETYYFNRALTSLGFTVFFSTDGEYLILPSGASTWEINSEISGTIATASAPTNELPFGLSWTILDPTIDQIGFGQGGNCPKIETPAPPIDPVPTPVPTTPPATPAKPGSK